MSNNSELQTIEVLPAIPEVPVDPSDDARSELTRVVTENFADIVEAQVDLAKGLWVKEYVKDSKGKAKIDPLTGRALTKVYLKAPDKDSGQYLINQVIGKPKENMVIAGKVNFIMDV